MAIYDASQMTKQISDCDSIKLLVDRNTCYMDVKAEYQEILKTNTDALNGPKTESGTYLRKQQQESEMSNCGSDGQCRIAAQNRLNITIGEIAVREARRSDAIAKIAAIDKKITTIKSNPIFVEEVKAVKQKRNIWLVIGVIVIIGLIIGGIFLYRKYKKG
jgi:hypothetical protein